MFHGPVEVEPVFIKPGLFYQQTRGENMQCLNNAYIHTY